MYSRSKPRCIPTTLQIKGRWESNINVWFPFMYSQNWNCYFQNRIIIYVSQFIHSYICERFIYFQDRSAYSVAGKYVDRSREYINCSQTHECGNWDWGRAIPRKGIHKWDFPCSAACQEMLGIRRYWVNYSDVTLSATEEGLEPRLPRLWSPKALR